jgi:hypothetical protein
LISHLDPFVRGLSSKPGIDPAIIQEFFLFTFLMVVITEARTTVFGCGDGLFAVNGNTTIIESSDNAPDYIGYRFVDRLVEPVIHFDGPTIEVQSLIIATDGAKQIDLGELARDPKYLDNKTLLHRRLNSLGAQLFDDTSVVLVRRSRCGC